MRELTFDTGKVSLNYADSEDGRQSPAGKPALVLLHGGSGRWQLLEALLEELSEHWHVYAPDLRGHGKSGRVAWGYTLRDFAADIAAFLQQVSGPAFVYGHSLGGMVALMTAGQAPQDVRGVLVGDAPLDAARWKTIMHGPQQEMVMKWRALSGGAYSVEEIIAGLKEIPLGALPFDPEVVYRELAERLYQHDPDVLGMLLDDFDTAAAGFEMETLFPAIRCPVLLMQADPSTGGVMTDAEVAEARQWLPQLVAIRFPGLSHLLNYEDPQGVKRAMEDFLWGQERGLVV